MTQSITNTVAGLVSFGNTVAGAAGSYDLASFAAQINGAGLTYPCFVVMPCFENVAGFQTFAMMGNGVQISDQLDHVSLYGTIQDQPDFTFMMATAVALLDSYWVALKALPFYTAASAPSNQTSPKVSKRYQQIQLLNVKYHAIIFRHQIQINI